MLFTLIKRSFLNQKKAMAVMIVSVAVGTAISGSLIALSLDISSKVSRELRSFGANIIVQPKVEGLAALGSQNRYLREEDIPKAKTIFWRHNIVGIAPVLMVRDDASGLVMLGTWHRRDLVVPGDKTPFTAGVETVMPWWSVEGRWPIGETEVLAGLGLSRRLGLKPGDRVVFMGKRLIVTGILSTGDKEDEMLVTELSTAQRLSGLSGKISQVFVSALTTPMDDFAYKDPKTMTEKEYEKWYCTGYVTSIAKQLEDERVFAHAVARPVWPVAETEGKILKRLNLLVYLLTILALISSALGVSTTMIMSLLRRTDEVALMKAVGADSIKTIVIFLSEALVIGILAGVVGYAASLGIAGYIGRTVFGSALEQRAMLLPVSIGVAVLISMLGAYLPIRRALSIRPAVVLKGGQ